MRFARTMKLARRVNLGFFLFLLCFIGMQILHRDVNMDKAFDSFVVLWICAIIYFVFMSVVARHLDNKEAID